MGESIVVTVPAMGMEIDGREGDINSEVELRGHVI